MVSPSVYPKGAVGFLPKVRAPESLGLEAALPQALQGKCLPVSLWPLEEGLQSPLCLDPLLPSPTIHMTNSRWTGGAQ